MTGVFYHGLTKGELDGPLRVPLYLAHDRDLAAAYGDDGEGVVVEVELLCENVLVLDTMLGFAEAWDMSGASGIESENFHPTMTGHFAAWVREAGYDAVSIPASAFETPEGMDEEEAFQLYLRGPEGLFGEPQTIVLTPGAARLR